MKGDFYELIEERTRPLRSKSRTELLSLGDAQAETVQMEGRNGTIRLIIEEETAGTLRVVMIGYLDTKWFPRFGAKTVAIDGFRVEPDGDISELRDDEFAEFV